MNIPKKILARQREITAMFLEEIDKHLLDIVDGRKMDMFEIRDIADIMHIHPTHLSNTIKLVTSKSPCYFFEDKILTIAKAMLADPSRSIHDIAVSLTYDPSNFTKFFKRFTGETPRQYREAIALSRLEKTEGVTI